MQGKSKKRGLLVLACVVVAGLAFPLVNLVVGVPPNLLSDTRTDDPVQAEAYAVLAESCGSCHLVDPELPFYASLPIARGMIREDTEEGLRYLNLARALLPPDGGPVDEVSLAKIEHVVHSGSMPPLKYLLLHWDGGLNATETDQVTRWVEETRGQHYATSDVAPAMRNEPVQPLPLGIDLDDGKVALGRRLFHDTRLSVDGTLSCASCHALDQGGTDRAQFSTGVGGALGGINSPTVYNSGFLFAQFWDGRAATLEDQAKGPVENPIEMAESWPVVLRKLDEDRALVAEFEALYEDGMSVDNIAKAIATFERSLITPNSSFDRYLRGEADAMTSEQQQGYAKFKELGCATCHVGKVLGGQSYERMGHHEKYFVDPDAAGEADRGRFNVTQAEEDRHKFKVPTLRNVVQTYPYLHSGSTSDLAEVVRIMAEHQGEEDAGPEEIENIVAFLETLTGEYEGELLR